MGVTIHFEGQFKDQAAFRGLIGVAQTFARDRGWRFESIEADKTTLLRVRNEENWDYVGPVRGVVLHPHADCDPMRLEFDCDLYIQEFIKTQFAGAQVHLGVVELLRTIEPFFQNLKVEDEGEYWETGNAQLLGEHLSNRRRVIDQEVRKNPSIQVKVKTPDGRILDLLS